MKAKLDATGKVSEIKSRIVVNGKQQEDDNWSNRSAPTVRHEHAMFALKQAINKKEQIATFDNEGAYLNALIPDKVCFGINADSARAYFKFDTKVI